MNELVVGIDAGGVSAQALDWAVHAVGSHGAVHSVSAVPREHGRRRDEVAQDVATHVRRQLDSMPTALLGRRADDVTTDVRTGSPAAVLRAAAIEQHADAIVVGTHVSASLTPRSVGSTVRELLRSLPCPLIVVPTRNRRRLDDGGDVVVGIGHSDATAHAVGWAAQLAEDRDLGLCLVRFTGEGPVFQVEGLIDLVSYYIDPTQRRRWALNDVEEMAFEAEQATQDSIEIEASVVTGLPATQLVDRSADATMLVIGQHRSSVAGWHIGQPLHHALTHAVCPVAVVP